MMDLPDKETRVALGSHASFKAKVYKTVNAELFIESSYGQAQEIVSLAGKPVLCTEMGQMFTQSRLTESLNLSSKFMTEAMNNPFKAFLKSACSLKTRLKTIIWKIVARRRKNI